MSEVMVWLKLNEQSLIDVINKHSSSILQKAEIFQRRGVDLSYIRDEICRTIKEGIEAEILYHFQMNPEDFLLMKEDPQVKQFIYDIQQIVIKGGSNAKAYTLH